MFDLTGKKALVTGASRGIGRGIAISLAQAGADVAINYRGNAEMAEAVATQVRDLGREAVVIQADVSKKEEVVRMFEQIQRDWGKLDILVNNAGIVYQTPFEQVSEQEWDQVIDVNLKSQFLCCQQAAKLMSSGAKIINLSSIASGGVGVGFGRIVHYASTKGASIALTEDLAVELGPKGINVNAIAPGIIDTDMTADMLSNEQTKQGLLMRIPKGRAGKVEDIGAAAVFLAADEADYVTGTVIYVDGGWLA